MFCSVDQLTVFGFRRQPRIIKKIHAVVLSALLDTPVKSEIHW